MNNSKFRARLQYTAINLAPSVVILGVIAFGAALHAPWLELSWNNDVLFVLLAFAALLPLMKLPFLFLTVEEPMFWQFGTGAGESVEERTARVEILQQRREDLRLEILQSGEAHQ